MDEASKLRYLKEVDYFSSKLENEPKSKVFLPLALAYLRLGKYDEAITVCQSGLDYHPDYIAAKTIMAQAFLGKGLKEEAKGLLIEVATLNPSNYKANKLLGDIYRAEENFEKSLYYYRTALIAAPEDNTLRMLIEELADVSSSKAIDAESVEENEELKEDVSTEQDEASQDLLDEAEELSEELERDLDINMNEIDDKINEFISHQNFDEAKLFVNEALNKYPEILSEKISFIEEAASSLHKEIEVEIPDVDEDFLESSFETDNDDLNDDINDVFETKDDLLENNNMKDDVLSDSLDAEQPFESETSQDDINVAIEEDNINEEDLNLNDFEMLEDEFNVGEELEDSSIGQDEFPQESDLFEMSDDEIKEEKPEETFEITNDILDDKDISSEENELDIKSEISDEVPNLSESVEDDLQVEEKGFADLSVDKDELLKQVDDLEEISDSEISIESLDDKVEQKLANLSGYETNKNQKIIDELENWLENIKKLKSKKNV
jgi:hypothetical protein